MEPKNNFHVGWQGFLPEPAGQGNTMENDKPLGRKANMLSNTDSTPPPKSGLTREVQAKIGQQLRAIYNDVVDQGVPDRFLDLLNQLDGGKPGTQGGDSEKGGA